MTYSLILKKKVIKFLEKRTPKDKSNIDEKIKSFKKQPLSKFSLRYQEALKLKLLPT
jgi:hypothetical protein